MKTIYTLLGAMILVAFIYISVQAFMNPESPAAEAASAEIIPIEHATGVLKFGDTIIYFDPTGGAEAFATQSPADIVLVTDIHGDHFSTSTLEAVVGGAALVVPQAVKDMLPEDLATKAQVLANGASVTIEGLRIEAVPMYNVPEAEGAFHTKGRGNGYIVENADTRVYIAGDTGPTPEMKALTDIDIALVPMNLPYTMSVEDAASAVLAFKPKQVYPYHYRGQGGLSDIQKFKQLVEAGDSSIQVTLASWYPQQ